MSGSSPAWSRDSQFLRFGPSGVASFEISEEWAFGGATGAGVRVAVIDSGIESDHPLLGDCVDADGAEVTVDEAGEVIFTNGTHGDAYGHGTACAGIIHSLAPDARITSVRVLGANLSGKAAAFHAGLEWAVDNEFDVINLSLGTTKREWALAFHEVCDRAYFSNSFVVTAANNVTRASFPSLFASVASVACNTGSDPRRFHVNPEPPTEFLARGINVEVAWLKGSTITTTGNSFAAPHIAGMAALIRSKHPELRPFQVKAALWQAAANVREATMPDVAGRRGTIYATAMVRRQTMVRSRSESVGSVREPLAREPLAREPIRREPSESTPESKPVKSTPFTSTGRELVDAAAPAHKPLAISPQHAVGAFAGAIEAVADLHRRRRVHPSLRLSSFEISTNGNSAESTNSTDSDATRFTEVRMLLIDEDSVGGRPAHGVLDAEVLRLAAPEQFVGGEVTTAANTYSLGLLGLEWLTGRPVFEGRALDVLRLRHGDPTVAVEQIRSRLALLDSPIATVLERATQADPSQRFADAMELGQALTKAVARDPEAVPRAGLRRWLGRG